MNNACADKETIINEENVQKSVEALRNLVLGHKKLKNFRTDDSYMLRFLNCYGFEVDVAFKKLEGLCNLYLEYPDWFATAPPLDLRTKIERNAKAIIPGLDNDGRRIFLCKLGNIDPKVSCLIDEVLVDEVWLESVMDDLETQRKGICVILDLYNYSMQLLTWIQPQYVKICRAKQDLYPVKEFVVHVVNTSTLLQLTKKLVWPIMPTEIKNNTHFHLKNWKSLHQHINPEILPAEYGGTGSDLDFDKYNQWLFAQNEKIKEKLCYEKLK